MTRFFCLLIACAGALFCSSVACARASYFTNSGGMNGYHADHTTTLLTNGLVLVAGASTTVEVYYPATEKWIVTNSMSINRGNHAAVLLADGRVLVSGGGALLASCEIFDPVSGGWSNTGSMHIGRSDHTMTVLKDGRVLVAGGQLSSYSPPTYVSNAEIYDPTTGLWSYTNPMNSQRNSAHAAVLLDDGQVLVIGGNQTATAEIFDPVNETWTPTGPMAQARGDLVATLLPDGRVLATGGATNMYSSFASAELFDPITKTWSQTTSMNHARVAPAATLTTNGKVLVTGGARTAASSTTGEIYDPEKATWTLAGSLPVVNVSHRQVMLPNKKTLIVGGGYGTNAILYVEPYPFQLGKPTKSSTTATINFTNQQGFSFSVLWTTNPSLPANQWSILGSAQEISPAQYRFLDFNATNQTRFYRVRSN